MKTYIFLGGMLLVAHGVLAQPSSKTEQRLIHINGKGEVSDDRGTKLGYISKEDIVFNNQGQKLGFIKGGRVYDAEGNSFWIRKVTRKAQYTKTISFMRVLHTVSSWNRK